MIRITAKTPEEAQVEFNIWKESILSDFITDERSNPANFILLPAKRTWVYAHKPYNEAIDPDTFFDSFETIRDATNEEANISFVFFLLITN